MKAQILLGIAATVAAAPASRNNPNVLGERDVTPGNFSVNNGTLGNHPDMTSFELVMTGYCEDGEFAADADFWADGKKDSSFIFPDALARGLQSTDKKLSGKYLEMKFNFDRHSKSYILYLTIQM